jgi:hypothetical protein
MSTGTLTNEHGEPAPLTYPAGLPDDVAPLGGKAAGLFRGLVLGPSWVQGSSFTRTCSGTSSLWTSLSVPSSGR